MLRFNRLVVCAIAAATYSTACDGSRRHETQRVVPDDVAGAGGMASPKPDVSGAAPLDDLDAGENGAAGVGAGAVDGGSAGGGAGGRSAGSATTRRAPSRRSPPAGDLVGTQIPCVDPH